MGVPGPRRAYTTRGRNGTRRTSRVECSLSEAEKRRWVALAIQEGKSEGRLLREMVLAACTSAGIEDELRPSGEDPELPGEVAA